MGTGTSRLSGGTFVAIGMMVMNVAVYGFTLVAARGLEPREFGALTALLGIILVGNVAALGLQASTARRIAVAPQHTADVIGVAVSVTALTALAVGAVVALSSVAVAPALRLDSAWPVVLCGATLVPLTVMGAQCGIAQGRSAWRHLTAIYVANGVGRLGAGVLALAIRPDATAAMVGIAVGAWLPVLVGAPLLRLGRITATTVLRRRDLARETLLGTHALLAYFVLSNLDALIARNRLDVHDSGLYASGLILTKAALFLPQFVSVVLYPDLARDRGGGSRLRAVGLVGACGLLAVVATALLPRVALVLVGGAKYAEMTDRLWLFALSGALLAIVHVLVIDALARHAHGIVVVLWIAVAAVGAIAYGVGVGITGLVCTVAAVAALVAVIVWFVPAPSRAPER